MVWISVVAIRAPLAPKGCPMAIAPPRTFTLLSSSFQHPDASQRLRRESFVQFDQIDVGQFQSGAA